MRLRTKALAAVAAFALIANPALPHQVMDHVHEVTAHAHDAYSSLAAEAHRGLGDTVPGGTAHTVAQPAETGSYAFTVRNADGSPGRWNPCQIHKIVVNPAHAPAGAIADLKAAVAKLDTATGLRFEITGRTSAAPTSRWGTAAVRGGWAPVLVAWGSPGTGPLGTNGEAGETQPVWVRNADGKQVFVSGEIVFASTVTGYTPGFKAGTVSRGALMLHELGHLAGLDHTGDRSQVMYPQIGFATGYGAGDLAGLKALGAGGCLAVPAP